MPPAHALLTAGDPIKNAQAILRYALPISNKPIRQAQRELESISEALRIPGSKSLGPISRVRRGGARDYDVGASPSFDASNSSFWQTGRRNRASSALFQV